MESKEDNKQIQGYSVSLNLHCTTYDYLSGVNWMFSPLEITGLSYFKKNLKKTPNIKQYRKVEYDDEGWTYSIDDTSIFSTSKKCTIDIPEEVKNIYKTDFYSLWYDKNIIVFLPYHEESKIRLGFRKYIFDSLSIPINKTIISKSSTWKDVTGIKVETFNEQNHFVRFRVGLLKPKLFPVLSQIQGRVKKRKDKASRYFYLSLPDFFLLPDRNGKLPSFNLYYNTDCIVYSRTDFFSIA